MDGFPGRTRIVGCDLGAGFETHGGRLLGRGVRDELDAGEAQVPALIHGEAGRVQPVLAGRVRLVFLAVDLEGQREVADAVQRGLLFDITHGQCLTMVANPLPINFSEFKAKRAGKRTAAPKPAREKLAPGEVPAEGSSSETPFSALPGASALSFSTDGRAVPNPSP